jgi:hypothetical protein
VKITYSIVPSSRTSLTFSIRDVAEVPKYSPDPIEGNWAIHNGKLYPVRPEVQ